MNCPVCGKRVDAKLYYCARCAEYVHTACWEEHEAQAHKD